MFIIIINIIGIIFCVVWLIQALINDMRGSAITAALLFILNLVLLVFNINKNINKMVHSDKFNVTIIETKTPPAIDTLIRHGAVSDTTYVITAIDAKTR